MDWIELVVHTTTEGAESVSFELIELGSAGTMIEDRADIPDPGKPHGIWDTGNSERRQGGKEGDITSRLRRQPKH